MKQFNRLVGSQAEKMAADFLRSQGYQIIEQNFAIRFGEIDIIAAKTSKLIFIEVKAKNSDQFGTPEEMITSHKIRQVQKMATAYLQKNPQIAKKYPFWRLDAVTINLQTKEIKHYENITE